MGGLTDIFTGGAKKAANSATAAAMQGLERSIQENRAAYGDVEKLYSPYSEAGLAGFQDYLRAIGQGTPEEEAAFLESIQTSPGYQAAYGAGNRNVLQNAAATGGLRGGNTQNALAEFGSGLFGQYYNQKLGQLQGLGEMGFGAAQGLGQARTGTAGNIAGLYNQQGQTQAQGILAAQAARQQAMSNFGGLAGAGLGAFLGPAGSKLSSAFLGSSIGSK